MKFKIKKISPKLLGRFSGSIQDSLKQNYYPDQAWEIFMFLGWVIVNVITSILGTLLSLLWITALRALIFELFLEIFYGKW